ncbi:hypothetical protein [Aquisalimonas sp.]|uniref:hypothetical protein n=1 Tax=Aquisalimonas sp. TaxID=1872621 RepID=UPI0025BD7F99|nr:hypothetical protein [Aquisalimonas sp.]
MNSYARTNDDAWEQHGQHWLVSGPYWIFVTHYPHVRAQLYRCWEQVGPALDSVSKAKHAAQMDRHKRSG